MSAAARLGDICTGHGCFPPRNNTSASNDVIINDRGAHRQSDTWAPHTCGDNTHDSYLQSGCKSVIINDLEAGRIGDPVACGSAVASGSPNVFIG